MKIVKLLIVCSLIASCQIHYIRTIPAPEVIVLERPVYPYPGPRHPGGHIGPAYPKPVKPKPVKTQPQKKTKDSNKKRPDKPAVKRPERPMRSDAGKKAESVYAR